MDAGRSGAVRAAGLCLRRRGPGPETSADAERRGAEAHPPFEE